MSNTLTKAKDRILNLRIFRFFLVAFIATVFNYSVFYVFFEYLKTDYLVASGIGFFSGVFLGYFLNSKWTFHTTERSKRRIVKYYSVYTLSLCISLICLKLFVERWGIDARIANVMAICVTFFTNYAGTRFWVFRKDIKQSK
jgi:putative flippase GtrA